MQVDQQRRGSRLQLLQGRVPMREQMGNRGEEVKRG